MPKQWNWQQPSWPHFSWDSSVLQSYEERFLKASGKFLGLFQHIRNDGQKQILIDILGDEAYQTSAIEGEFLDRQSLQSSLQKHLGIATPTIPIPPKEQGIIDLMLHIYQNYQQPLTDALLFEWHTMLMRGFSRKTTIGCYRTHEDPMQIVSGPIHEPVVHYEAPPSRDVPKEMNQFLNWFNSTNPNGSAPLPALQRSGLAHLYFESIHPFEDGNGRIGRAIAEKSLSQSLGEPLLVALSQEIYNRRKHYYQQLADHSRQLEITGWLVFFAETILDAQSQTLELLEFVIAKTRFYDHFEHQLNQRQIKAIERMFREGPKGFEGGLSHANYVSITAASRATASRDLQDMVKKGAFSKTGEGKGTRYFLGLGV